MQAGLLRMEMLRDEGMPDVVGVFAGGCKEDAEQAKVGRGT